MSYNYCYQEYASLPVHGTCITNHLRSYRPTLKPQTSFLDLPASIRAHIYRFIPQMGFGYTCKQPERRATIGDHTIPEIPAIAKTCRFLRGEVVPLYYSGTVFHFWKGGSLSYLAYRWLDAQQEFLISRIEMLEFESLTFHYDECHFTRCAARFSSECKHKEQRTSRNCVKHYDKIVVDVPGRMVLVEPSVCYKVTKDEGEQQARCDRCDHVEYCELIAIEFRDILMNLPTLHSHSRMTKTALRAMLRLAIGSKVDGRIHSAGMTRSEIFDL
ncbi:hypothetical protein Slin15195_G041970 [Septoria linicola]|uniref:F-box domain-containing protein n=1 Tax=Septoria linicola TaxID=215465 RepID=A0A9Q9ARK2_9PEZI|nr:hypothetical protein Slin14017_G045480 [Septoria linicola]USW50878.1 hypothetical protein Slin15195_G041970 [Septoria linicola]